jgi:hypothetical protein
MKQIFLISTLLCIMMTDADAQKKRNKYAFTPETPLSTDKEENVVYNKKHFAFGGKLTTDGYGGFLEIGRLKSVRKSLLYQFEITERKHNKEEKMTVNFYSGSPVIYGKINYFYPVKIGAQYSYLLGNKGNKNGVSVTAQLGGGLSMAMLRPYMLKVQTPTGDIKYIRYEDDEQTFTNGPIVDGPNFLKGWSHVSFVPGFYAKPAVRFDYGRNNTILSALEVGATFEYYTKDIEQMIFQDKEKFFMSGYVAVIFGKRKKSTL